MIMIIWIHLNFIISSHSILFISLNIKPLQQQRQQQQNLLTNAALVFTYDSIEQKQT